MRDVLGQGGNGEPRPRRRRLAVAFVLALVTAVVVAHLALDGHARGRPARARGTASQGPPAASGSLTAPGQAAAPDGVTGQTLPWDASIRLPVTGRQPTWFWPATGRSAAIGGLPPEGGGYQFIRVSGGWAVQAATPPRPGCGTCAGPPQPAYFLGDTARSAIRVGVASQVAPAATARAVWLTSYPAGADPATVAGTAQQVSVGGAPLGPRLTLPAGYRIDQGTDRGLLLAAVAQRPGGTTYELWDPARRSSRAFTGVIAASATEVAWAARCAPACQVRVLNLVTGRTAVVSLPGASSAASGAFSPDGAFLAVEVSFYTGGDGGALAAQLDVASAASGRLTVVPGTWVSSDALAGFGWPGAGDSLIAELSFTTKIQVAAWSPGAVRLAVTAISPGPNSASLIVG